MKIFKECDSEIFSQNTDRIMEVRLQEGAAREQEPSSEVSAVGSLSQLPFPEVKELQHQLSFWNTGCLKHVLRHPQMSYVGT